MNSDTTVICPGCARPVTGKYCSNCGFKLDKKRISLVSLMSSYIDNNYSFEFKLFKTIKNLFTRPFSFVVEFIDGQRRQYYNPLKYFILTTGINVGIISYFDINHIIDITENPALKDAVNLPNSFINSFVNNYAEFLYVLIIPLCMLGALLVYRKTKYNLGEQGTVFFFMGGSLSLIAIPFNIIIYFYPPFYEIRSIVIPLISLVILFLIGYKFYNNSLLNTLWKTIIISIIVMSGLIGFLALINQLKT